MKELTIKQDYEKYSEEDHETWRILIKRQAELLERDVSREYLSGFNKLQLSQDKIIVIEETSRLLESISGWSLVPVTGLIPNKEFFYLLINKKYPINISIRKPHEIEFSEQPDIFHDVCGHIPLLTNEKFVRFLTAYSTIALRYINNEKAIELLGRLYWFTYEMGIINEGGYLRPYGGAIITSSKELINTKSDSIKRYVFDLSLIFKTPYDPYKLQKEYFVINSFDDLFDCIVDLEKSLIDNLLLPRSGFNIHNYSLNERIGPGFNNVIGFLNDIQYSYTRAISFVAGQPDEQFFDIENQILKLDVFVNYLVQTTGETKRSVINKIGQYNKTKGIINDIVAEYLRVDENINIKAGNILITVGAQEAFTIIVSTVCDGKNDVIIAEDPSYIGLSSFAKVFNFNIVGTPIDKQGIILDVLEEKIIDVIRSGKRVKLLYVIPDYQNPSGCCMPIENRIKLLELARQYNFLIIEDSVYNSFTYMQKKLPTLKSLDKYERVVFVGSFSKLLFPGLRIGVIAADQIIEGDSGDKVLLIDEMVKVKAQLTNNTSTISQAILGGVLLENSYSLSELNVGKYQSYKRKRDCMIGALRKYIGAFESTWAANITWTEPEGGFFIKMSLPFEFDKSTVIECANRFHVIVCPMRYFYLDTGGEQEIRLTFSNLSLESIEYGVQLLANFLKFKIEGIPSEVMSIPEGELS